MQYIHLVPAKQARQLHLLSERIIFRRCIHDLDLAVLEPDHLTSTGPQNEQVIVLRRPSQDCFGQALHVPADARVFDSAKIEGDFHGTPGKTSRWTVLPPPSWLPPYRREFSSERR